MEMDNLYSIHSVEKSLILVPILGWNRNGWILPNLIIALFSGFKFHSIQIPTLLFFREKKKTRCKIEGERSKMMRRRDKILTTRIARVATRKGRGAPWWWWEREGSRAVAMARGKGRRWWEGWELAVMMRMMARAKIALAKRVARAWNSRGWLDPDDKGRWGSRREKYRHKWTSARWKSWVSDSSSL